MKLLSRTGGHTSKWGYQQSKILPLSPGPPLFLSIPSHPVPLLPLPPSCPCRVQARWATPRCTSPRSACRCGGQGGSRAAWSTSARASTWFPDAPEAMTITRGASFAEGDREGRGMRYCCAQQDRYAMASALGCLKHRSLFIQGQQGVAFDIQGEACSNNLHAGRPCRGREGVMKGVGVVLCECVGLRV